MNSNSSNTSNQKDTKNKKQDKNQDKFKVTDNNTENNLENKLDNDNVLLDTTDYIVTPKNTEENVYTTTSINVVDVVLNHTPIVLQEKDDKIDKLTEQLDFFKNLAEENKEEILTLKNTLDENKRLVVQLVEENDELKNKINKMNNIDLLLKLKENFNNKHVELISEIKNNDENISEDLELAGRLPNTESKVEAESPKIIVVKQKKRGNPFARRFL